MKKLWKKIATHHTSGKTTHAGLGQIVMDQLDPKCSKEQIAASVKALREQGGIRVFADGRPFIVSRDDVEQIVAEIRSIDAERERLAKASAEEAAKAKGGAA